MQTVLASLLVGCGSERQKVRLRLTEDTLYVDKEELSYSYSSSYLPPQLQLDSALLSKVRHVCIKRDKPGGLGLSVKGGAEHNLPILVSRIFKDQAADRTGQIYVGDAILEVNGMNVESWCHDDVVAVLKNAGDNVLLTVKYFEPATGFLSLKGRKHSRNASKNNDVNAEAVAEENGNSEYVTETRWSCVSTVPLLCAFVSRYQPDDVTPSKDRLDVAGVDSVTVTVVSSIQFESSEVCDDWIKSIQRNIAAQNALSISLTNASLLEHDQVIYMSWVCERSPTTTTTTTTSPWKKVFLSLKGADLFLYETPPVKTRDWVKCEKSGKIYESTMKILKGCESTESRPNCFEISLVDGCTHCLSIETREELLQLEKAWYKATYIAVKQLACRTFGCTCNGQLCGLTLDLSKGFNLYNSQTKASISSYRFSQLKGSSDDGKSLLRLDFKTDYNEVLDVWELECTELRSLLYTLHAFLSAKLASIDPVFLLNL